MSNEELKAMSRAALLGATHYQRWETFHKGEWVLSSLSFFNTTLPPLAELGGRLEIAAWSAFMNKFTETMRPSHYWEGYNMDKANKEQMCVTGLEPLPESVLGSARTVHELGLQGALREHVREFIEMELTSKLEEQVTKALSSGAIDLTGWDGVNLNLPRALTTAILREAADRVIWERSHGKSYAKQVNNIRAAL